ncbi:MAG: hypothetical protein ACK5JS_05190 [Mangrovibacterium sp.]
MTQEFNLQLISLMLPEGILEYFDVVSFKQRLCGKYVYNKKIAHTCEDKKSDMKFMPLSKITLNYKLREKVFLND